MAKLDTEWEVRLLILGMDTPAYSDFSHRAFRPDHVPEPPRPRGIGYSPFMSPQHAAKLLCKVARKSKASKSKPKPTQAKAVAKK